MTAVVGEQQPTCRGKSRSSGIGSSPLLLVTINSASPSDCLRCRRRHSRCHRLVQDSHYPPVHPVWKDWFAILERSVKHRQWPRLFIPTTVVFIRLFIVRFAVLITVAIGDHAAIARILSLQVTARVDWSISTVENLVLTLRF
jgi:hypothetical protein